MFASACSRGGSAAVAAAAASASLAPRSSLRGSSSRARGARGAARVRGPAPGRPRSQRRWVARAAADDAPAGVLPSLATELATLADLQAKGVLTAEQFERAKDAVIAGANKEEAPEDAADGNRDEEESAEERTDSASAPASEPTDDGFKTSLGDDPAFAAALSSVSSLEASLPDPASASASEVEADAESSSPPPPTPEDFVPPVIDWGDVKPRSIDEDDAFPITSTAAALDAAMESSAADGFVPPPATSSSSSSSSSLASLAPAPETQQEQVRSFLYPDEDQLPDDVNMTVWEHLEELRDRALISAGACAAAILLCFCFAKDLVIFLEAPVASEGVRFLQLGPGEYFFTTVKVAGYCGLLLGAPVVLYEAIAYVVPGLTRDERKVLGPIVLGSSVLFYAGIVFAYSILTPAALKFFVGYSSEAVESLWSIDQYFEFVLVLLFSTGLSFQVPVIQLLLGQTGLVSSKQMLSVWRYVVVGSVVAAAVLTPSTDPFTQMLLAVPLMSLYLGGAAAVGLVERKRDGGEELPEGR